MMILRLLLVVQEPVWSSYTPIDDGGSMNDEAERDGDNNDQVPGDPMGGPNGPRGPGAAVNLKDPKDP